MPRNEIAGKGRKTKYGLLMAALGDCEKKKNGGERKWR